MAMLLSQRRSGTAVVAPARHGSSAARRNPTRTAGAAAHRPETRSSSASIASPHPALLRQRSRRERENPKGKVTASLSLGEDQAAGRSDRDDRNDHTHRAQQHGPDHDGSETDPHPADTHTHASSEPASAGAALPCSPGSSVANAIPAVSGGNKAPRAPLGRLLLPRGFEQPLRFPDASRSGTATPTGDRARRQARCRIATLRRSRPSARSTSTVWAREWRERLIRNNSTEEVQLQRQAPDRAA